MRKTVLLLLLIFSILYFPEPAKAEDALNVFYAGPEGKVRTALTLADHFTLVSDPLQADVFVLNGNIPLPEVIASRVRSGAGLLLIMGPGITPEELEILLGVDDLEIEQQNEVISLIDVDSAEHRLLEQIVWNSAPQVRERFQINPTSALQADLQPMSLVTGFEQPAQILEVTRLGEGLAYLIYLQLDESNPQFQSWAYFNYLVYYLSQDAAGAIPQSFANYRGSPVPHSRERLVLFTSLALLLALALGVFWLVRRYSLAHPEQLDVLVANRQEFETRQANTDWEEIGFHRPLGGFMLAFMLGLVLFIPLIIYQNLILPVYILPSAQALGIWGRVVQFFNFLWLLLDMGTSAAFIKFFAQYRVHDPRQAIQYGQIFVWWQALSGAVQVALVTVLAGTVMPHTVYALYAWSVIIHTFIQIPGFYQVMRHSLMTWQRFDYAQMLDLSVYLVFPILVQPAVVAVMVAWGRSHPVFGESMGGLLGLGIAAYLIEVLSFLLGLWLYRRLGYNARLLFLAHFDWQTVKNAFRFGVFEMLGSVAWAGGQALEIVITQTRLVNYTEVWGNWGLAQNFIFSYNVVNTLYNNLMPSISEAISNTRKKLSQYYSVMAYKWGGLLSAYIGAVLLAVADRFILGASGPEFVRAAGYAVPLVIWGAIQYPSWVGDNVQLASNRPYLKTALVAAEQVIRIILVLILLERFQINALIIAYFVGLLAKDFAAYFINHRICFPQSFYFWQSLGAPLLAGAAHFLVLRWSTGLIWKGDQVTSVLIFLIGILLSYPVFAFFYGFFGGWDDDTLAELGRGVSLSNFMQPMARLFWTSTALGARLSPLHGRFPIDIRQEALQEAQSLTDERVDLY